MKTHGAQTWRNHSNHALNDTEIVSARGNRSASLTAEHASGLQRVKHRVIVLLVVPIIDEDRAQVNIVIRILWPVDDHGCLNCQQMAKGSSGPAIIRP